jgi:hypothetical protein
MFSETLWDHEVDVLCIGAEGSVLAAGIVAARADLDVYLGITQRTVAGDLGASVGYAGGDRLTTRHIVGFDYAFGQVDRAQALWPLRTVDDISPSRSHHPGSIEPFFGAQLEPWARRCASASDTVVYDRVGKRQMTAIHTSARGEKVEAAVIGSVPLSPELPALSVMTWLKDQATLADLRPHHGVRLVRLIFEDGLVGALIDTEDGQQAVRARENLIIGVGDPISERTQPLVSASQPVTAYVCLVSKAASRFGELEIITAVGDDNRLLFVDTPEAELQLASGL